MITYQNAFIDFPVIALLEGQCFWNWLGMQRVLKPVVSFPRRENKAQKKIVAAELTKNTGFSSLIQVLNTLTYNFLRRARIIMREL